MLLSSREMDRVVGLGAEARGTGVTSWVGAQPQGSVKGATGRVRNMKAAGRDVCQ